MAEGKVIVVTGISGSGSRDFCRRYAESREKVKTYHTGDMIYQLSLKCSEEPPIPIENFLNKRPSDLDKLRDMAFEQIFRNLHEDRKNYERILIDTHGQFFWNDVFHNAYNWKHLGSLDADLFISMIEKPSVIRSNQMKTEQGKSQDHDLRDILLWQNIEVNVTSGWASNYRKPMYVLPAKQDPKIVDSLLFNDFLVYFQMPMTEANDEQDKKISRFKEKLLGFGKEINGLATPLIDPRDIDIETGEGLSDRTKMIIRRQTVHRDLNWYIHQATDLVAFYPEGTSISKGVSDESTRGFETGKSTFVVFPKKTTSPFMDIASRVFHSENEFFEFFPVYMRGRLEQFKRNQFFLV